MTRKRLGLVFAVFAPAILVLACRGAGGEGETHSGSPEQANAKAELGKVVVAGHGRESSSTAKETGSSESPAIRFEETEFDFGEAEAGKDVEHLFSFRNVGTRTLTIEKVGST